MLFFSIFKNDFEIQTENKVFLNHIEHNHVLKTVIYDDELSMQQNFEVGEIIEKTFQINLSELEQYNIDYSNNIAELGNGNAGNWNANNISVITYIYNTITKEVVQVEEAEMGS